MDWITPVIAGGAAGVALYVLNLLVTGKLHTNSEVQGLRADNKDQKQIIKALSDALKQSNETSSQAWALLRRLPVNAFDRSEGADDEPR